MFNRRLISYVLRNHQDFPFISFPSFPPFSFSSLPLSFSPSFLSSPTPLFPFFLSKSLNCKKVILSSSDFHQWLAFLNFFPRNVILHGSSYTILLLGGEMASPFLWGQCLSSCFSCSVKGRRKSSNRYTHFHLLPSFHQSYVFILWVFLYKSLTLKFLFVEESHYHLFKYFFYISRYLV